ncbi:MAG: hypothetical protein NTW96_26800 [Planctomycetia bacterium]|nr:hypothetical protein [Planctomycetia bacterium]
MEVLHRFCLAAVPAAWLVFSAATVQAEMQPVGKDEAVKWTRWVVPLPHEIDINSKVVIPVGKVAITVSADASALERQAADELAEVFQKEAGCRVPIGGDKGAADMEIVLGTCGKDGKMTGRTVFGAERLFTLPCADQAYRIVPLEDHALGLVGTRPEGVYYAAKTLKQLLSSAFTKASGQTLVAIPMAQVTDWPDMSERGLWGGSANEDIEWMAERKMNLVESHIQLSVDDNGRGVAVIPEGLLARSARHAVKFVPIITHLEQLPRQVFVKYPELAAVGEKADTWRKKYRDSSPVCFSQPKMLEILTDWLSCLARYPEVTDVNVWLSEENIPCACEKCAGPNLFTVQTQLVTKAWKVAKRIKPDLRVRILLTQGSYQSNAQVLEAAPPEMGVTYYHGGLTYDSSRNPMIYPLLEKYAAQGRWLGCYPQLTPSYLVICPWSGPQFIKARMSEFVSKRLQCLCGYVIPATRLYDFNVTAAAEWSWNAAGRTERDFSLAWATRRGLSDPEKAADWAVMLGEVGWDVYGAAVPFEWVLGNTGVTFKQGQPPTLGSGIFKYFPTREHFDENLAVCDRAMRLAEELNEPAMIEETRVIRGLTQMLKGLYVMGEAASAGGQITTDQRQQAAAALVLADRGCRDAYDGLLAWTKLVSPEMIQPTGRYADMLNCLEPVVMQIAEAAVSLGVSDPNRIHRPQRIGEWTTQDFTAGTTCQKTWEISKAVVDSGRYQVVFHTKANSSYARIKSVAFVSSPTDDPARQTERSRETREDGTESPPKYNLSLDRRDPEQRYFIVVELDGGVESARCSGHVTIRKAKD